MKTPNKKGFTLVELLVVISIISLLASIVFTSLQSARVKARNTAVQSQVREYISALYQYKTEKGYYPIPNPNLGFTFYCLGSGVVGSGDNGGNGNSCTTTDGPDIYQDFQENQGLKTIFSSYIPEAPNPNKFLLDYGYGESIGSLYSYSNGSNSPEGAVVEIFWMLEGSLASCALGGYDFNPGVGDNTICSLQLP